MATLRLPKVPEYTLKEHIRNQGQVYMETLTL